MRLLFNLWAWTVLALVVLLGPLVLGLIRLFTFPFDRRRLIVGRAFRLSSVLATRLVPGWRFRAEGPIRRPRGPTVVVSNHRSQSDTFLVSELPWEMKWLAKAEAFKAPFLGWSMRLAGDVAVQRGNPDSAREAMDRMGRWLEQGVPVMLFPEGTRSRTKELRTFKDGAFRLAIQHQADVLPLALCGTESTMPAGTLKLAPGRGRVRTGEPIPTAGLTLADLPVLKARVREAIEDLLAEMEPRPERTPATEATEAIEATEAAGADGSDPGHGARIREALDEATRRKEEARQPA